jgi:hypothetical protein
MFNDIHNVQEILDTLTSHNLKTDNGKYCNGLPKINEEEKEQKYKKVYQHNFLLLWAKKCNQQYLRTE